MKQIQRAVISMFLLFCCIFSQAQLSQAQQTIATNTNAVVPPLVNFTGTLTEPSGRPLNGTVAVTFSLYSEQTGGAALWMETQSVQPDVLGHYTVMLGSTSSNGLPADIFEAGQAHWLGVQVQGQEEQARVLLVSAPYALKAGDAQTVGGLPASAFMLANGAKESNQSGATSSPAAASAKTSPPANPDVTGKGTADYIPMWDTASDIVNSAIFQKSGAIGIATTSPAATLDVNGKGAVRDTLVLFPKSTDNTLAVNGTAFAISSAGKVTFVSGQTFPGAGTITGITTATGSGLSGGGTSGTLSLKVPSAGITNAMLQNSKITLNANSAGGLTTPGAMTLGNTYTIGLKPCSANQVLEYSGTAWNCSATGTGTITGVTAGSDLTGGGTGGNVTLNLDTTKVPLLAASNTFTAEQIFNTASGNSLSVNNTSGAGGIVSTAVGAGVGGWTTSSTAYGGVEGFDGSSSGTGGGVYGYSPNGYGVKGVSPGGYGVVGSATTGAAVFGSAASGTGVLGTATTGYGVYGSTASGGLDGVHGVANSNIGSGVAGVNTAQNGTGIYGSDTQGYGFVTDSHVSQGRSMGGWAKAMVYLSGPSTVARCFNSQIAGSTASTAPCGITLTGLASGYVVVDFGFEIDDRFVMASFTNYGNGQVSYCLSSDGCPVTSTQVYLYASNCVSGGDCFWDPVYIVVF